MTVFTCALSYLSQNHAFISNFIYSYLCLVCQNREMGKKYE